MVSGIFSSGVSAYQNAQKTMGGLGGVGGIGKDGTSAIASDDSSFSDMLSGFAQDTIANMKKGETATIAAAKGQADITDVVGAVQTAMRTLELVTTVRDKVISAYQDILRMPI